MQVKKEVISESKELLNKVVKFLDDKKADDIKVFELGSISPLADYICVVSGTSERHVQALGQTLYTFLKENGVKNVGIEGLSNANWILIDAIDIIIHVFKPEVRSFYGIDDIFQDQEIAIVS